MLILNMNQNKLNGLVKKIEERTKFKYLEIILFSNNLNFNNPLNNIDFRVKWYMGKWYYQKYLVDNKNHKNLVNLKKKEIKSYPFLKIIMKDFNYFLYAHGDINHHFKYPIITKTRPVLNMENSGNIILPLNFYHHWNLVFKIKNIDKIVFEKKINKVFWRGASTGELTKKGNRFVLLDKWFKKNNNIDVGLSLICHKNKCKYIKYVLGKSPITKFLEYKYLVCAEGNDVATGLKWMLYSNSVILMPKPTVVSWFMEDHLIPNKHYVLIKDDWSDLLDKFKWCEKNQQKCKEIINNANKYIRRFLDEFHFGLTGIIIKKITDKYKENVNYLI